MPQEHPGEASPKSSRFDSSPAQNSISGLRLSSALYFISLLFFPQFKPLLIIKVLLDAAVMEMQQYSAVVARTNITMPTAAASTAAPATATESATVNPETGESGPSSSHAASAQAQQAAADQKSTTTAVTEAVAVTSAGSNCSTAVTSAGSSSSTAVSVTASLSAANVSASVSIGTSETTSGSAAGESILYF